MKELLGRIDRLGAKIIDLGLQAGCKDNKTMSGLAEEEEINLAQSGVKRGRRT